MGEPVRMVLDNGCVLIAQQVKGAPFGQPQRFRQGRNDLGDT
jgi:hypothetical protein